MGNGKGQRERQKLLGVDGQAQQPRHPGRPERRQHHQNQGEARSSDRRGPPDPVLGVPVHSVQIPASR